MPVNFIDDFRNSNITAGYCTDYGGLWQLNDPACLSHYTDLGNRLGIPAERMVRVMQKHTDDILCADCSHGGQGITRKTTFTGCDGIITDCKMLMLCVVVADCAPVYLFDPVRCVTGLVHSGRAGTIKEISAKAVVRMHDIYGTEPADVKCFIGPHICQKHHEVEGKDILGFYEHFSKEECGKILGQEGKDILSLNDHFSKEECEKIPEQKGIKYYVDMAAAIRLSLMREGLLPENISADANCTYETPSLYSWRRDHNPYARNLAFIFMQDRINL